MRFPTIQRGSMQQIYLHRSCSLRSKVQGHFDIPLHILIEDDSGQMTIGSRINSRRLHLGVVVGPPL